MHDLFDGSAAQDLPGLDEVADKLAAALTEFQGRNDFNEWHPRYHPAIEKAREALAEYNNLKDSK